MWNLWAYLHVNWQLKATKTKRQTIAYLIAVMMKLHFLFKDSLIIQRDLLKSLSETHLIISCTWYCSRGQFRHKLSKSQCIFKNNNRWHVQDTHTYFLGRVLFPGITHSSLHWPVHSPLHWFIYMSHIVTYVTDNVSILYIFTRYWRICHFVWRRPALRREETKESRGETHECLKVAGGSTH